MRESSIVCRSAGDESHKANGKASNGGADTGSPKDGEIITCRVSDIEPQPIDWLWEGRLARGKLTLIAGDPGLGKSQIGIDLHARLSSTAYWPDGTSRAPIANSIILSAEDAASDTLRPGLEAADADLQRVWILDAVRTKDGKRSVTLQQGPRTTWQQAQRDRRRGNHRSDHELHGKNR